MTKNRFKTQNNEIITIFGKKGQGKTVIAKLLVYKNVKPTIIIDPLQQFESGIIFKTPESLWAWLSDRRKLNRFYRHNKILILQFFKDSKEAKASKEALFERIFEYLHDILFVVDELDMHFHSNASSSLSDIFKYGRNHNISIIDTSKRPASIHNDAIEQTDIFILFKTATPDALKQVTKHWEDKEALQKLKSLRRLEFLAYDNNKDAYTVEQIQDKHFKYISLL